MGGCGVGVCWLALMKPFRLWILQHIVILCYRAKTIVLVTLQRCVARLPLREVTCLLPNFVLRPPPAPRNDAPVGAVLSGVVPPARTRPASRVIAFHFLTRARVQLDFCMVSGITLASAFGEEGQHEEVFVSYPWGCRIRPLARSGRGRAPIGYQCRNRSSPRSGGLLRRRSWIHTSRLAG